MTLSLSVNKIIEAVCALDRDEQKRVYYKLEQVLGLFPCVVVDAEGVLENAKETLTESDPDENSINLASFLTIDMAESACGDTAERDWSDSVHEAMYGAECRLIEAARCERLLRAQKVTKRP